MSELPIVKILRVMAQRQTATGISEPSDHTAWMAADTIEALAAALEPLVALYVSDDEEDDETVYPISPTITAGHIRRARAALARVRGEG